MRVVSTKDGVKVAGQDVCRDRGEQEVGELSTWRTPEPALEVNDFDQIGVFPSLAYLNMKLFALQSPWVKLWG